jgi:tellurite resistance protein TerC
VTARRAALWSAVWVGLGLGFGGWIAASRGTEAGITWLTAYLLEMSLSVDNLFVFILIFSLTGIPAELQSRALFWGILGAIVMRAAMILLGVELLERFHWAVYPLAALLVYAAYRMLRGEQERFAEQQCALCESWLARFVPIEPRLHGSRFVVRINGRLMATPLLVALTVIETTDLVFAVDSIPAVFAVTRDPFLVYTSNVFALLGLRSLYFLLAGVIGKLRFLKVGLAVMLLLAASKLALGELLHVPPLVSLAAIVVIFSVSIGASLLFPGKTQSKAAAAPKRCPHGDQIEDVKPNSAGCEECLKTGDRWVQLRMCLKCGHVGCCDSSKHKHATAHFRATAHPVMRSIEPGENWKWCYVDKTYVR